VNIRQTLNARLDTLQSLVDQGRLEEAAELLPSITKFWSIMSEEDRDYVNAIRTVLPTTGE
jgi:hypothetical protein